MTLHSPPTQFSVSCKSDPMLVRSGLLEVMDSLAPARLLPEESGTVELVLAEVMNNIAEHAYEERPDGDINIRLEGISGGILCFVTDYGKPMPDGKTPLGAAANLDVDMDDLPEGGFGWFLIGELAKDVVYERAGNENRLSFRMAVGH